MNYYKLLKVRPGATKEEIKKAYKQLAFHFHPDRGETNDDYFMMIHEAYEALMKEAEAEGLIREPRPPAPIRPAKHNMSFVKGRIKKEQVWAPDFKHLRRPKITVETNQCPMCDGYGTIRNKYKITMNCPRCRGTGHKTRIII